MRIAPRLSGCSASTRNCISPSSKRTATSDLITVAQFNWRHRRSRGIGFGNEDRTALERMLGLNKKLHIPLIKENRHFRSEYRSPVQLETPPVKRNRLWE